MCEAVAGGGDNGGGGDFVGNGTASDDFQCFPCWPLVQLVLRRGLPCGSHSSGVALFDKTMVMFAIKLLTRQFTAVEECATRLDKHWEFWAKAEDAFYMLKVVVLRLLDLVEAKYDVVALCDQCTALRSQLDQMIRQSSGLHAAQFMLPDKQTMKILSASEAYPDISMRMSPNCAHWRTMCVRLPGNGLERRCSSLHAQLSVVASSCLSFCCKLIRSRLLARAQ